jgi:hypothetical protein
VGCWVEARCHTQSFDATPSPSNGPIAPWVLTATVAVKRLQPPPHCPRLVLHVSLLHQRSAQASSLPLSPLLAPDGGELVRTQWLGAVEVLPAHRLPSFHCTATATTTTSAVAEHALRYPAAAVLWLHTPDDAPPAQSLTSTALTRALERELGVTRVVSEQGGVAAASLVVLQGAGSHVQMWTSARCALLRVRATSETLLTTLTQTVEHALRPMGRMQRLAPSLPLIQVCLCLPLRSRWERNRSLHLVEGDATPQLLLPSAPCCAGCVSFARSGLLRWHRSTLRLRVLPTRLNLVPFDASLSCMQLLPLCTLGR